ncbi:MAG: hypothetical protein EZS28_030881 [Streblomastix strix]|uniref:Uncharacterized protein n=1 Tax=Streblomastix strix TaxID=222440 RepID=A0A5J4UUI8_9EUKA|nr:MAG: hypothetical protein EZS28_030881 [Streblomastix strix]
MHLSNVTFLNNAQAKQLIYIFNAPPLFVALHPIKLQLAISNVLYEQQKRTLITHPFSFDTPSYIVNLIYSNSELPEMLNQPLVLISISLQVVPFSGLFANVRGEDDDDIVNIEERVVLSITYTAQSVAEFTFDLKVGASNVKHFSIQVHEFKSLPFVPTQNSSPETSNELCYKKDINRKRRLR